MEWSREAEEAISGVPFFVRRRVRKRVEEEAARVGAGTVEMTHVETCRKAFLNDMSNEVKGYRLEVCFGDSGCPNRIAPDPDLVAKLDKAFAAQNLKSFLKERVQGPLKIHHEFRVTLADCPNACSRPQISDLGIIAVRDPVVGDVPCSGCMSCVTACAEEAVSLDGHSSCPSIDPKLCLLCGQCVRACASGTLIGGREGYRLLLGGKLGRHPQLARQLDRLFDPDEIPVLVEKCLVHYKTHSHRGERFGEILNRTGYAFLE